MKHSATSLKTWVNCPRLFKAKYVDRIIAYQQSPAAERGEKIHAELEDAVRNGTKPSVWTPPGLMDLLHKAKALVEGEVAVNYNFDPVDYKSKDAWLRGKIDARVVRGHKALVVDWKTGKVRPDKIQADMYTALVSSIDHATEVEFRLVYVDQKQVVNLSRDSQAWDRIRKLAYKVEQDKDFLPNPSWLCKWCDFTACRYNERRDS